MPPLVLDVMEAQRAALLRGDEAAMREMAQRWLQVEQALQAQVDALALELANHQGPLTGAQLVRMRRYVTLQQQIAGELNKYAAYVEGDIRRRQLAAGLEAIEQSSLAISAAAADAGIQLQFDRLPVASVERMVGLAGDGSPLRAVLADASRVGPDALAQELITGTALGLNPREIARRAMRQGLGTSLTRMLAISRTEVVRVARQTTQDNYRNSKVVRKYRRVASKSRRTCVACLALDGQEYSLDVPFEEHVNGRCTMIPVLIRGEPVRFQTGREWFEQQPQAVQRQMMGKGRWEMWRDGQVSWNDLITIHENERWGNSPGVTPLRELRRMGGVFPAPKPKAPRTTKAATTAPAAKATSTRKSKTAATATSTAAPGSVPVSQALTLPSTNSTTGKAVNNAVAAIDQVHGDGNLPSATVKVGNDPDSFGYYVPYSKEVLINTAKWADHPGLTTAHELGHFLDDGALGIGLGTRRVPDIQWQAWKDAIDNSAAIKSLRALRANGGQIPGSPNYVRLDYIDYMLTDVETWARSYAQFVAQRSQNGAILKELVKEQTFDPNIAKQWQDADFEPIALAIEQIFRGKGWLQ